MKFKQIVICYRFIPGKKDPDADITEFEACMQQAIKKYNCLFQFASADLKKGKGRIWFEKEVIKK